MTKIAIVDIDGCLCPSIFANLKHNDNNNLRNHGFEKQLSEVKPFKWATEWDWRQYDNITVITGRLRDHNDVTFGWLVKVLGKKIELKNTEWDDSYPTREESHKDYVKKKVHAIVDVICIRGIDKCCEIFEDSEDIINTFKLPEYYYFCSGWEQINIYQVKDGELVK